MISSELNFLFVNTTSDNLIGDSTNFINESLKSFKKKRLFIESDHRNMH